MRKAHSPRGTRRARENKTRLTTEAQRHRDTGKYEKKKDEKNKDLVLSVHSVSSVVKNFPTNNERCAYQWRREM
jgi:hypothetical protein